MNAKKFLSLLLSVLMVVGCMIIMPFTACAEAWDGSSCSVPAGAGTSASPYLITNADELAWLSQTSQSDNLTGKYFQLENDIDLGGKEWLPIGSPTTQFKGKFDGKNHTVSNFICTESASAGLFGRLINATVKNVVIDNAVIVTIASESSFGGALAGYSQGSIVTNITVNDNVSVTGYNVGGIIGRTWSTMSEVSYCVNNATVSTDGKYGGEAAGGIVGLATVANISYCINNGKISTKANAEQLAGGIAGRFGGTAVATLSYCLNTGDVSSTHTAGAIAGKNMYNGCKYEHCVSTVPISGGLTDWSGNLVGRFSTNAGSATECYVSASSQFDTIGRNAANASKATLTDIVVCTTAKELAIREAAAGKIIEAVNTNASLESIESTADVCALVGYTDGKTLSPVSSGDFTDPVYLYVDTLDGAAVRLNADSTGLRWQTATDKAQYDAVTALEGVSVSYGTLIAPEEYVALAGEFTAEALENALAGSVKGTKYLDVKAGEFYKNTDSEYIFAGSLSNIIAYNYSRQFSAVGYVAVTYPDSTVKTFYSTFTDAQTRSVYEVATAALADAESYEADQLAVIEGFYKPVFDVDVDFAGGAITVFNSEAWSAGDIISVAFDSTGKILTVTVAQGRDIGAVVVNGKRVAGSDFTFTSYSDSGVLTVKY